MSLRYDITFSLSYHLHNLTPNADFLQMGEHVDLITNILDLCDQEGTTEITTSDEPNFAICVPEYSTVHTIFNSFGLSNEKLIVLLAPYSDLEVNELNGRYLFSTHCCIEKKEITNVIKSWEGSLEKDDFTIFYGCVPHDSLLHKYSTDTVWVDGQTYEGCYVFYNYTPRFGG